MDFEMANDTFPNKALDFFFFLVIVANGSASTHFMK